MSLINKLGIDEAAYRATAKAIKHDIEATIGRPLPVGDTGYYIRDDIEFGSEEYFRAHDAIEECRVLATYSDDTALEAALAETREFNQKERQRIIDALNISIERSGGAALPRVEDLKTPASRFWQNINAAIEDAKNNIDLSIYEPTEDDTARLFVDTLHQWFRYNHTDAKFMIYTGTHWTPDLWNLAGQAADAIARWRQEGLTACPAASIKETVYHIKRLRTSGGNRAIQYFASCDPRVSITREDLDTDEHIINTPSGVVDLETGAIRPHRREDLLSKITRYAPDANHKPRYFDRFLDDVTCGRDDLKESLQRFIGSGASGRIGKALVGIAYGDGAAGKSTLFEACGAALGNYAASADMKTFTSEQRSAGHSEDLASLAGVRFLRTGENTQGVRLDEGRIKRLTGGDETAVSHKGARSFQMYGKFTLCIYTNHRPRISGRDGGIWRRVSLFPFDWKIPEESKDPAFREKMLDADGPYILAWIIEGARKWYQNRGTVMIGDTVREATEAYRQAEDIIGQFLAEECVLADQHDIAAGRLREHYEEWCKANGEHAFGGRAWGQALEEHGLTRRHTIKGKVWIGVALKKDESLEELPF